MTAASQPDHPPAPEVRVCFVHGAEAIYAQGAPADCPHGFAPSTSNAVGIDLRACFPESEIIIRAGERYPTPSGITLEPVTPGFAGFVYARSGLGAKHGLTVAQGVGLIDPDYRGEIIIWLLNTAQEDRMVKQGERVAQLVFQPYLRPVVSLVDSLGQTGRGSGGFGHTGRF